jgi:8-oxo-dGTP diphosphatase
VERVALSVDVVCFAVVDAVLEVLLVRRAEEPFTGVWALPGGVVCGDEPLDAAASRILTERTGVASAYLEQLYTFGDAGRDPRGRTISVAYYALLTAGEHPVAAGRGVEAVRWQPVDQLPGLAFDHRQIVDYARQRLAQKVEYAPLVFRVLPETFTMRDLRVMHEAVQGRQIGHASNFATAMMARWDLAPVPEVRDRRTRRPARLYRYIGPRKIAGPPPAANGQGDPRQA